MPKVRPARTKPDAAALNDTVLVGADGASARIPHRKLEPLAMKWSYYVRNRHRWADSPSEVRRMAKIAFDDLRALQVTEDALIELSTSSIIEAQIGFQTEQQSWAGRIFPWEFVLSSVRRLLGPTKDASLIVRHIRRAAESRENTATANSKLLFVSSAPGPFAGRYEFEDEHELLRYPFEQSERSERVDDPTRSQLAELCPRFDAVHLSGIDTTLGAEIIARRVTRRVGSPSSDGFYLATANGEADLVEAVAFAKILTDNKNPPRLVTFNAFSSAPRLASLAVAAGAGASIGFQDRFEDAQSEQFFAVFYRRWASREPLLDCFRAGFQALRDESHVGLGSGIVLWSGRSLISEAKDAPAASDNAPEQVKRSKLKREDLRVRVELPPTLNYPKLHNGENLFKRLRIYNHGESTVNDVRLDVVLQVGSEVYTYNHRLDLKHPSTALEHKVRVALSWALMRSLTESVQTTILVRAAQNGTVFHEDTYPIELLPANEWVDDDNSGPWLPSLVLPRDPAVTKIIDCARRYLRVLADNAFVGFDGYQQIEIEDEEQHLDEDQCFIVDVQVRAIWYALMHDYRLGYINPPPTFNVDSQRVRRPSEVISERHGTCIDLALLFAACLEYIGINPVLFLIDGHAFPGYWRIDRTLKNIAVSDSIDRDDLNQMLAHTRSWSSGRQYWKELKLRVERGQIVPLETVDLTAAESFDVAVQHGRQNLKSQDEFNTMLDVMKAREQRVTPLPL